MKITMSFKEVAALADIVKEVNDLNSDTKRETIQEMMVKVMENFKEPEKYGFVSMSLDTSMNLVIEADTTAVIRIMELIKKYILVMYPLLKAANEIGMNFGKDIQEIVDDYTEKEEKKEDSVPANFTITHIKRMNDCKEKNNSPIESSFQDIFDHLMNYATEEASEKERIKNEEKSSIERGPKTLVKKFYICPKCGRSAMIHPNKNHKCNKCGVEMDRVFE